MLPRGRPAPWRVRAVPGSPRSPAPLRAAGPSRCRHAAHRSIHHSVGAPRRACPALPSAGHSPVQSPRARRRFPVDPAGRLPARTCATAATPDWRCAQPSLRTVRGNHRLLISALRQEQFDLRPCAQRVRVGPGDGMSRPGQRLGRAGHVASFEQHSGQESAGVGHPGVFVDVVPFRLVDGQPQQRLGFEELPAEQPGPARPQMQTGDGEQVRCAGRWPAPCFSRSPHRRCRPARGHRPPRCP